MKNSERNKISIVIPVHNRKELILKCLSELENIDRNGIEISTIVIDDGSSDGTSEKISLEYPYVVILKGDGNLWWSGATNIGVNYALKHGCDYVLMLNDDIEFRSFFLSEMLQTIKSYNNAIICGVICDEDEKNTIISAGRYAKGFLRYNYSGYLAGADISMLPQKEYESDAESGYAMLIPKIIFQRVGLFDIKHFPHHMGDMDFVLRAKKKGFQIIINPRAILYTKIGNNYFHNQIINVSLWHNIKMFFNIRSTVNLRTRWFFCWRHTPYYLGGISYLYFLMRMTVAIFLKIVMPTRILKKIIKKRCCENTENSIIRNI